MFILIMDLSLWGIHLFHEDEAKTFRKGRGKSTKPLGVELSI